VQEEQLLGSGESFMGTVPPGLLSWQPHSLTLLFCSSEKSPSSTALPRRIPNVRHFGRANTTGLIVLQQQQLSESKLNGVSHVQSERRRRRRLRERRCDGSEQVLREYTLHSNSFNSSTNWYGNWVFMSLGQNVFMSLGQKCPHAFMS